MHIERIIPQAVFVIEGVSGRVAKSSFLTAPLVPPALTEVSFMAAKAEMSV